MLRTIKEHKRASALVTLAAAALTVGGYYYWRSMPPPMPRTAEQAIALVKSERFQRLTDKQKRYYHDRIAEVIGPLDAEKRRELMRDNELRREGGRDVMQAMMMQRAREYAMASPEQREAMVAQARAEFMAMRGSGRPGGERGGQGERGQRPEGEQRPPRGEGADGERPQREELTEEEREQRDAERRQRWESRIESWVNEGNAQEHALMREYFRAIREGWEDRPERPQRPDRRDSAGS